MYNASIWQSGGGNLWYVNDTTALATDRAKWWYPARLLNIPLVDYVRLLIEEFHVSKIYYKEETDFLFFCWDNYKDANRYKLWVNREIRKKY